MDDNLPVTDISGAANLGSTGHDLGHDLEAGALAGAGYLLARSLASRPRRARRPRSGESALMLVLAAVAVVAGFIACMSPHGQPWQFWTGAGVATVLAIIAKAVR